VTLDIGHQQPMHQQDEHQKTRYRQRCLHTGWHDADKERMEHEEGEHPTTPFCIPITISIRPLSQSNK
jgi:hypothetical protein